MRHKISGRKLSRSPSHRLALMRNLSKSLIDHERITTTLIKAKELKVFVEPILNLSKEDTLSARRLALRRLATTASSKLLVSKLFDSIGPRVKTRKGGYTRIIKLGKRLSDNTEMALIELVDRDLSIEKNKKEKREKKQASSQTQES